MQSGLINGLRSSAHVSGLQSINLRKEKIMNLIAFNGFITDGLNVFLHAGCNTISGFDSNSSSWFDLTENRHNGILNNFAGNPSSGWDGGGTQEDPYKLVSDGVDDSVSFADTVDLTHHISSFQFSFNRVNSGSDGRLFEKGYWDTGNPNNAGFFVALNVTQIRIFYTKIGGSFWLDDTISYNYDEIINIAGTYDGNKIRIYKNGAFVTDITAPVGDIIATPSPKLVLCSGIDGGTNLNIDLHNFAYYDNKVLTPEEVAQNYNAGLVWK